MDLKSGHAIDLMFAHFLLVSVSTCVSTLKFPDMIPGKRLVAAYGLTVRSR